MVLDDMVEYAEWYLRRARVPVLIINLWSYPDPVNPARSAALASPAVDGASADEAAPLKQLPPQPSQAAEPLCATELTTYLDGEAAYSYLIENRQLRADGVLVHGVSIGGAVGASIALNHPGVRLTFDQPFCTLAEVTRHMTEGVVDGVVSRFLQTRGWARTLRVTRACVAPPVSSAIAALLVRMCFKRGLGGPADGVAHTDRFDNAGKAARIAGQVFVLYASEDEMMHPDAAQRILRARYGSGAEALELRRHTAAMEGGHMSFFGEHEETCRLYLTYLRDTGFLPAGNGAELLPALLA
jgi:pimeloyl-ACP methyl ester carboxylesterase